MTDKQDIENEHKRLKIQQYFFEIVGTSEHINIPKLEAVVRKEFKCNDDRFVRTQIELLQTEGRIKIQNNAKVWIKLPTSKTGK